MAVADEASKRGEAKGAVVEDMENDKKMQIHLRLVECMFDNRKQDVNGSIARVMISKLNRIHDITLDEIAYLAHSSPASVTKFCKKLGYASFKDLKADYQQFQYAYAFQDMINISDTRGIDAALIQKSHFHYS